jgi:uncharacterized protein YkwD
LTNQARSSARFCGGTRYPAAGPLAWNAALSRASNAYAGVMARTNNFRHDPNIGRVCSRAEAENIGHGYQSPEAAVTAWIRSPSHCANLMNGQYDSFGGGKVGTYWVQKLGRSCR